MNRKITQQGIVNTNTKVKLSLPSITPKWKEFLVFLCGLIIAAALIEIILVCGYYVWEFFAV